MFLSRGDRDLGVAFQTHLRSHAWYRGEGQNSALLSSPNAQAAHSASCDRKCLPSRTGTAGLASERAVARMEEMRSMGER